ncbi:MAG: aminoglycoside phosphotransferase family protein, partial [Oscillospiraceae bacterium]|nr:aminoglycoside phosphotransferase family protein [Oscillospiraceae bacterium]
TAERQQELLAENKKKRREQGIPDGEFYHFDTPFTPETEMRLMTASGFTDVEIIQQWENTSIIIAKKRDECVGSVYGNAQRDADYINSLLDFIREEYGIESTAISPTKRGYYGETWKMDAADRSYFLKLDYSDAHRLIYERSFSVMEHLRNHGIDFISRIVKTSDGRLSIQYEGAVLGVFDWIDGENVQNKRSKIPEYHMLAKIYTVPGEGLSIPREDFSESSAELFFKQWNELDDENICSLFEENRDKLEHRAARLKHFSTLCRGDTTGLVITHGDAGGNIIASGDEFYIVDWDDPTLAPPERDAWFCIHWCWAMDAFNSELRKNGMDYTLRPERLAYYCYHSFFFYLTEYMSTYFEIGNRGGEMVQKLKKYFNCWIEDELHFADTIS